MSLNTSSSGTRFYSILVHIPKSQVIIELVSKVEPTVLESSVHGRKLWKEMNEPRFSVTDKIDEEAATGVMTPLHISRAVQDTDEIAAFYDDVFGMAPTESSTLPDGSKQIAYKLSEQAT